MKIFRNYLILLIGVLFVASCQKYDNDVESASILFDQRCTKDLGIVYNGQDWGFGEKGMVNIDDVATRTNNPNSNEWASKFKLIVPDKIADDEAEYVYNWFATNQNPSSLAIHWSDFFVQHVTSYNQNHSGANRNMDQLGYESMTGEWEHVYNFNASNGSIQYIYDAGTENWTYRSSFDNKYHNDLYTIQYLSFDVNGHHYEGFYVGFDYEAYVYEGDGSLRSGSVFADGYYNDWVIKVTPGIRNEQHAYRVMCEDLGNTYDWDYNDVVFDVSFEEHNGSKQAIIVLRAAGGIYPIKVGTTDDKYEIHKMFDVPTTTILTYPNKVAIYRVDVTSSDPKHIPVYVNNTKSEYVLKAEITPQEFCCKSTVAWSPECVDIRTTYPKWANWVNDCKIAFWEE